MNAADIARICGVPVLKPEELQPLSEASRNSVLLRLLPKVDL